MLDGAKVRKVAQFTFAHKLVQDSQDVAAVIDNLPLSLSAKLEYRGAGFLLVLYGADGDVLEVWASCGGVVAWLTADVCQVWPEVADA